MKKLSTFGFLLTLIVLSGCAISPQELNKRGPDTLNVYEDNTFVLDAVEPARNGWIYSHTVHNENKDVILALSADYKFHNIKDIKEVTVKEDPKDRVYIATITFQDGRTQTVIEPFSVARRSADSELRPALYWILCDRQKNCPAPRHPIISLNGMGPSAVDAGLSSIPLTTSKGDSFSAVKQVLNGKTAFRHLSEQELQERIARNEAANRKAEEKRQEIADRKARYADELKKQLPKNITQHLSCYSLSGGDICSPPHEVLGNHLVCETNSGPTRTTGPDLIRNGWKLASYSQSAFMKQCGHTNDMYLKFVR